MSHHQIPARLRPTEPAIDSESWTCRGGCGAHFIGKRPPDDVCRSCTALALATAPYAAPVVPALPGPDALDRLASRADQTAELDGNMMSGRFSAHRHGSARVWHCPDCGANASRPGHDRRCWRHYITTTIYASPAAHRLREAQGAFEAFMADGPDAGSPEWVARLVSLSGELSAATAALLAVIDTAAGAR